MVIASERLKEARERGRLSVRGLATELKRRGVSAAPQTLTYVEKGQQGRVRQSVFDALVEVLRKPFNRWGYARWLAGEDVSPGGGPPRTREWAPLVYYTMERDLEELRGVAIRERPAREAAEAWHRVHLGGQLQGLYNPATWRDALLSGPLEITVADAEAAAEHGSAFLRVVLRPWIEGRATFRQDAQRQVVETLRKLLRPRT